MKPAPEMWATRRLQGVWSDMRRMTTFLLPGNGQQSWYVWFKHDVAEGLEVFTLAEDQEGCTWLSPDGNWNMDLGLLDGLTYDEAFRFLSRCALAPPVESTFDTEARLMHYRFGTSYASDADPYKTWLSRPSHEEPS